MMSNHYHLLISTPKSNLSEAMTYLHREVAKRANSSAGRINHFFGGRYKWSLIENELYYWNAVKYILRNPVEARMCNEVQEYEYSSFNDKMSCDLWQMLDVFTDNKSPVNLDTDWLNEKFSTEHNNAIKIALRRKIFTPPVNHNRKRTSLDPMRRKKVLGT